MILRSATIAIALAALVFTSGGCGRRKQPPQPAMPARPMPQPLANQPPGGLARPITIRVMSRLGPGQIKETTTLTINGVTHTINLDLEKLKKTSVDFTLNGPGVVTFTATCQTTYPNQVRHGRGNGQFHVGDDTTFELFMREGGDPFDLFLQTPEQGGPLAQVTLAQDFRKIQRERKMIDVPPGEKLKVKLARTVEHKIAFKSAGQAVTDRQLGIPLSITATIKSRLADALNRPWTNTTTIEEEITLEGATGRRYEIIWYDHIRTGVAAHHDNGLPARQDFEVTESASYELRTIVE
ncbi:MAG: hypothetical protein HYR84_03055 [Planctomycetes bacterium]|nr:hypothetical protein [Planctomycetota bacterium]